MWGIPYMMIRVAVRELSPQTLVFFRSLLAAVILTPFALREGGLRRVLAHWPWLLAFTALEMSLPWLLMAHAEQRISSSLTGLLIGAMPLIAVVLYRAIGESYRFDARHIVGLAAGFAGVAALVGLDVGHGDLLGVVEVLAVAVCWALAPVVLVKRLDRLSSLSIAAATLLISAAALAPLAAFSMPSAVSAETMAAVVGLAVVCTALAFLVYFALIREVGPSRSAIVTYVNPLVAVLLGVVVLDEALTLGIAVGTPLILVGSVLATAPSRDSPAKDRAADLTGL